MMLRNVRFTEIVWEIDFSPIKLCLATEGKQSIGLCSIEFDWFGNRTHTNSAVRFRSIAELNRTQSTELSSIEFD